MFCLSIYLLLFIDNIYIPYRYRKDTSLLYKISSIPFDQLRIWYRAILIFIKDAHNINVLASQFKNRSLFFSYMSYMSYIQFVSQNSHLLYLSFRLTSQFFFFTLFQKKCIALQKYCSRYYTVSLSIPVFVFRSTAEKKCFLSFKKKKKRFSQVFSSQLNFEREITRLVYICTCTCNIEISRFSLIVLSVTTHMTWVFFSGVILH